MTVSPITTLEPLIDVLHREAHCLDTQRWDDWLALYGEAAQFWMPRWIDDHQIDPNPDPDRALILLQGRAALAERVAHIREHLPASWLPLPRTSHSISTTVLSGRDDDEVELQSSFTCHLWHLKRDESQVLFGRYIHRLRERSGGWLIASKEVRLMNARLPTMIDFYCV